MYVRRICWAVVGIWHSVVIGAAFRDDVAAGCIASGVVMAVLALAYGLAAV